MKKSGTTQPRGAEHKRRIYMRKPIWEALDRVCAARGEKISAVLTKRAKAYIRLHASLLRKHNYPVPEEAFLK